MRVLFLTIILAVLTCSRKKEKKSIAQTIITDYYKTQNQAQFKVLSESNRKILDSVVIRLEESNEPTEVIQYIVNDFKMEYGE